MLIFISNKQFERFIKMVSAWKESTDALISTIATGAVDDEATKDAVTALQAKIGTDEAGEAALGSTVDALGGQVSSLTDALTETQTAITEIVTKLQAGDTAGALAAAQAAAPTAGAAGTVDNGGATS